MCDSLVKIWPAGIACGFHWLVRISLTTFCELIMCLILFSYKTDPYYRLVFAANRDEFYKRPSEPASFWREAPQVLAGRDLVAGGTWFGITRKGRWAAITNYRDPRNHRADAPSRGLLVSGFLLGDDSARVYLEDLAPDAGDYNGFSMLAGDAAGLFYFSNRRDGVRELPPGIYGLSNHFLDTPWPKVRKGKDILSRLLSNGGTPNSEGLFRILADRIPPDDCDLPQTGVGLEWERVLSPLFIWSTDYGTVSSMVLLIDNGGKVVFRERTFAAGPQIKEDRVFEFDIE